MRKLWLVLFTMLILAATIFSASQGATLNSSSPQGTTPPDKHVVVRIDYNTRDQLNQLAAELDVWEVHPEGNYVIALVEPSQYSSLQAAGYSLRIDAERSNTPDTIPGYSCYRTINELYADLQTIVNEHPNIAQISSIGTSYQNRQLMVMQLTNRSIVKDKPVFFLMANTHGRELITPETAMTYIDYLTDNYGVDADATWLLDEVDIRVLVSSNPDGHVKNELGEPWAWWRKNVHNYGCSDSGSIGVDLNRNYGFHWNQGGSDNDPCSDLYHGPMAVSEPEVSQLETYVRSLFPEWQRPPGNDTTPAPSYRTGMLITLHSYAELVLWPWGWSGAPAPNSAELSMIGRKLAYYNGYTPQQSYQLYQTSGSTDDWSYGELGVASYTFEMGGPDFYPSCSQYDQLIQPNIPALVYAAKISRTPYMTAQGPDALNIQVVKEGSSYSVKATINDDANGDNLVTGAQYYIDSNPWNGGTPIAMQAEDGAFNNKIEPVTALLPADQLPAGKHMIFVRGMDSTNNWGAASAVFYTVITDSTIAGVVSDDSTGSPIAGAAVDLQGTEMQGQWITDESGSYSASVIHGTYTATVSSFGYFTLTQSGIEAVTQGITTQDFALVPIPTGEIQGSVRGLGSNLPIGAHITVLNTPLSTDSQPETGAFNLALPSGTYSLEVSAAGYLTQTVSNVVVSSGTAVPVDILLVQKPALLLVDDDWYGYTYPYHYEVYYQLALDAIGIPYDSWDTRLLGDPPLSKLQEYPVVLWFTGNDRTNTLNSANQTALTAYLSGGGNLFLTGQDIAADINDSGSFLGNSLHAAYGADNSGGGTVTGSGVFAGLTALLNGVGGGNNQTSPDSVSPASGGTSVFTYTDGSTAGVAYDSTSHRSVFLSYGVEGARSDQDRQDILLTGLAWLGSERAPVDLRLSLASSVESILPGEQFNYTLGVENSSAIQLSGLTVTVQLPVEVDFVSASPSASVQNGAVVWSGLTMPSLDKMDLEVTVQVKDGTRLGTLIHASVYSALADQLPQGIAGAIPVDVQLLGSKILIPLVSAK